ncbi:MAG TPA: hypothetical protein VHQ70_10200 [Syntrophomonadaceae bacterium]|nr:hypothetical protein [Syntrophomonadaceae bacterium]
MNIASVVQTQNTSTSPAGIMANKGYTDKNPDFAQYLKTASKKTEPKPLGSAGAWGARKLFKYAHGNIIYGSDIQKELDEDLANFKATINKIFKQLGIDSSIPVELQVDQQGYVRVTNNHPDKEKVEQMFKENEDLRNTYVKIQSFTDLLESGRETIAFQKAYAKNPQAAVAQYSYLFNEDKHSPRLYTSLTNSNGVWRVDVNPMELFKSRYQSHSSEYPSTSQV